MPVAVAVVALVGGLAAATFVKAFGTAFLAMPRTIEADQAHESPRTMQVGLIALSGACVALALAPTVFAEPLQRVSNVVGGLADGRPIHTNGVYLQLSGISAGLSPLLLATGLAVMMVAALAVVRWSRVRHTVRDIPAWGCGRTVQTSRMEYTATSFAEPLQRVFDDVLHPEIDVDVDHHTESRHYVQAIRYRLHTRDAFEQRLYLPLIALARRWGNAARRVQNGSIHRYLTYSLVTLIVVLVASR
jgi:NADH:ubiquinone oxidoreductase subunit 5 (subunit L)/multisubunit Na+/H+ antiporter MnhA subunit